jgi:hypothetical protein
VPFTALVESNSVSVPVGGAEKAAIRVRGCVEVIPYDYSLGVNGGRKGALTEPGARVQGIDGGVLVSGGSDEAESTADDVVRVAADDYSRGVDGGRGGISTVRVVEGNDLRGRSI